MPSASTIADAGSLALAYAQDLVGTKYQVPLGGRLTQSGTVTECNVLDMAIRGCRAHSRLCIKMKCGLRPFKKKRHIEIIVKGPVYTIRSLRAEQKKRRTQQPKNLSPNIHTYEGAKEACHHNLTVADDRKRVYRIADVILHQRYGLIFQVLQVSGIRHRGGRCIGEYRVCKEFTLCDLPVPREKRKVAASTQGSDLPVGIADLLQVLRQATSPAAKRSARRQLRTLGHRGGLRS